MSSGDPIVGELHDTDASSGVAIPLYRSGTVSVRALAENEYLDIHSVHVVTAVGGDCHVFIGADSTPAVGETVIRGTFAANGGISSELVPYHSGIQAGTLWVIAPAGVVDVLIKGTIRKA